MDLLQLKYFKVVAEQEHITKSAKLLMVSQPYLSAIGPAGRRNGRAAF